VRKVLRRGELSLLLRRCGAVGTDCPLLQQDRIRCGEGLLLVLKDQLCVQVPREELFLPAIIGFCEKESQDALPFQHPPPNRDSFDCRAVKDVIDRETHEIIGGEQEEESEDHLRDGESVGFSDLFVQLEDIHAYVIAKALLNHLFRCCVSFLFRHFDRDANRIFERDFFRTIVQIVGQIGV